MRSGLCMTRGLGNTMILYSLVCDQKHTFDSWFRNSTAYDRMAEAGVLSCPLCGSSHVSKALTAPYVSTRGRLRERERSFDADGSGTNETVKDGYGGTSVGSSGKTADSVADGSGSGMPEGSGQGDVQILTDGDRARRQVVSCVRRLVRDHCDYVGTKFAEEARKMHYGESEPRPIYGEASLQESQKLQDEGVSFVCLPFPKENA